MQITRELLEKEVEKMKASVASSTGALNVLVSMLQYVSQPDPVSEPPVSISAENANIQAEFQAEIARQKVSVVNADGKYEEKN